MKRKIIQQGNNSYTVTLPIKWVREQGLEDNEVEINEEDGRIVISIPEGAKKKGNFVRVNLGKYHPRTIKSILNGFYRKGFDKVTIGFESKEQLDQIKKSTRDLLGFEVVEEDEKHCVLQNIAEPSGEKYEAILRKVFLSIKEDSQEMLESWKKGTLKDTKKYEESKNLVDTYTNFCRRVILKDKIGGSKESYFNMILLSRLSLIYHSYYYLAKFISSKKKLKVNLEIMNIFSKCNEMFSLLMDAFYKQDLNILDKIAVMKENTFNSEIYPLLQRCKGEDNVILYHLGEAIRLIQLTSINNFSLIDYDAKGA
ncbi:MAG: AbrB/MazE/SpoVT family DNA-binding domain-containing protein [Nanoarchaeota archaeon]|nr:AbrB/MazE/SpoVT family DNA-binding domain-containing protein [Nanoarchaeota archaeon]